MISDPDVYQRIVKHHIDGRPPVIPRKEPPDVLRPEDVGQNETPYLQEGTNDWRGTGDGAVKEPKSPETT